MPQDDNNHRKKQHSKKNTLRKSGILQSDIWTDLSDDCKIIEHGQFILSRHSEILYTLKTQVQKVSMETRQRYQIIVATRLSPLLILLLALGSLLPLASSAQGTAFTYQGHLNDSGAPATGTYDLRFTVYDSTNSPGAVIAGPITNAAVTVNQGLFVAQLDFGPGVFTGPDLWLEIGVRTNGGSNFTELTPRQFLSPVPYAIFAGSASNLLGTLPATQLSGTLPLVQLPPNVITNNSEQVNLSGIFNAAGGNLATTNFVQNNFAVTFPSNLIWQTNLPGGISNFLYNTEVPDGTVVVCPYSNLPPSITNNPHYFGPWMGLNYVQQAINYCAEYPDRISGVGGGKILVVGINYCPAPLIFANSLQSAGLGDVTAFDVEAPSFTAGGLVCAVNPCIRLAGVNNNTILSSMSFTMKNLIVSSLDNSPTNLFEMEETVSRLYLGYNWFGFWGTLTNHQDVYGLAGLTVPTTSSGVAGHNLTLEIWGSGDDMYTVENNSFLGIQGVYFNPDHGTFRDNFFSYCGGPSAWTTSAWAAGATIVLGQNVNSDRLFEHNYFYGCPYTYLTSQGGNLDGYTSNAADRDLAVGDANIEGTYNTIRVNGGYILQLGGTGMLKGSSFAASMSGGDLGLPPSKYPNAVISVGTTTGDYRFNMDSTGFTLSSGSFNGNGSGLTGLNASSFTTGTLPSSRLNGTYAGTVAMPNPANSFAGSFSGNGSGLTFTNAAGAAFSLVVNSTTNGFILVPH